VRWTHLLPLPHISLLSRVFLGRLDTPPVFIDYISPIGADSNRLRLVRTDLKLFGEIKDTGESGVFVRYKKTAPILLSLCFQFAFNRTDSKRDSETRRDTFTLK
jgi:hypothetical protein